MAYDEALAERIRALMAREGGVTEKKMFGGLAFLVGGNMAIGRPMAGWLRAEAGDDLEDWVGRGVAYARSLPPK